MREYKPSLTGTETLDIVVLQTAYLQTKKTENLDSTFYPCPAIKHSLSVTRPNGSRFSIQKLDIE